MPYAQILVELMCNVSWVRQMLPQHGRAYLENDALWGAQTSIIVVDSLEHWKSQFVYLYGNYARLFHEKFPLFGSVTLLHFV